MPQIVLNDGGWYLTRHGIQRSGPNENAKGVVTIQWSLLSKQDTDVRGVKRLSSKYYNIDIFMLRKMIDGLRVEGLFDTREDALRYMDKALIKRGKEPRFIFKKK